MLLGEPPPTAADLHFQVFGIPVRVHPFFWVVAVMLGVQLRDPIYVMIWVACVFVSILVHELGHALAALAHGWKPWITLYGFGGLASYRPTHHEPRSQIIISAAGPCAGFFLIAFVLSVVHASGHDVQLFPNRLAIPWYDFEPYRSINLTLMIHFLYQINVFWGLINLLPVYPLDGGQIARELLVQTNPQVGIVTSLWLSLFAAAGVAVAGLLLLQATFLALMFAYLAYMNYMTLQAYTGRG